MTTERKVTTGLAIALVIMVALGGAAALSGFQLVRSADLLDHSYEVLRAIEDLHIRLLRVEAQSRGYAISGSQSVLEGYEDDREAIIAWIEELPLLVRNDPDQLARAQRLGSLLERKIAFTNELIAARNAEGIAGAERLAVAGHGIELMREAASVIEEFEQEERNLLERLNEVATTGGGRTMAVAVLGWVLAAICAAVAGISIHRDLATRRRAQNALQESNEALALSNAQFTASNQQLEAFSYSVSHDLRAPLRAIDGYARMLAEDHAQDLDSEGQRLLETVRTGAREMAHMIHELLRFSRVGYQSLRMTSVDMEQLTREAWNELTGCTVGNPPEFCMGKLPPALGDRDSLRQVMTNLLSNAIKFSGKTEGACIDVASAPVNGKIVYFIHDNGCGFDMKQVNRLFKVFQRLHGKDEFDGTGVGLALVQNVIQRHGGRVWAEGEPGEGATFYFTLPGGRREG